MRLMLSDRVGLDPEHGLVALPAGALPGQTVTVNYAYAFSGAIGSGLYDRSGVAASEAPRSTRSARPSGPRFDEAVTRWQAEGPGGGRHLDHRWRHLSGRVAVVDRACRSLPGHRGGCRRAPTVVRPQGVALSSGGPDARLVFQGLILSGFLSLGAVSGLALAVRDCTLVPAPVTSDATPSPPVGVAIFAPEAVPGFRVTLKRCLCGAILVPASNSTGLIEFDIADSIIGGLGPTDASPLAIAGVADGSVAGPVVVLRRVTLFGGVVVQAVPFASDVLFTAASRAVSNAGAHRVVLHRARFDATAGLFLPAHTRFGAGHGRSGSRLHRPTAARRDRRDRVADDAAVRLQDLPGCRLRPPDRCHSAGDPRRREQRRGDGRLQRRTAGPASDPV